MKTNKVIIGRTEKVDLPELFLNDIDAKIDTGAYSSAIHCHNISENKETNTLHFNLLDPEHPKYDEKEINFYKYSKTVVKSSNGKTECRFKIRTSIIINNKKFTANFTLSDRSNMKYAILLGREILKKGFLVDVEQEYMLKIK